MNEAENGTNSLHVVVVVRKWSPVPGKGRSGSHIGHRSYLFTQNVVRPAIPLILTSLSSLPHSRRTQCPDGHDVGGGRGRPAESAVDAEPGHAGRDDAALASGGGRPDADAGRPHQRRELTV